MLGATALVCSLCGSILYFILSEKCIKNGFSIPNCPTPLFMTVNMSLSLFSDPGKSLSHHLQLHFYCHLCGRDDTQGNILQPVSLLHPVSPGRNVCRPYTETSFFNVCILSCLPVFPSLCLSAPIAQPFPSLPFLAIPMLLWRTGQLGVVIN